MSIPIDSIKVDDVYVDDNGFRVTIVDILPNSVVLTAQRPDGSFLPNLQVVSKQVVSNMDRIEKENK